MFGEIRAGDEPQSRVLDMDDGKAEAHGFRWALDRACECWYGLARSDAGEQGAATELANAKRPG